MNTDYTLRESPRKERAFHAMIAGAGVAGAGCFLPWIQSPFGSLSGMSLRPGQLALLVSAICVGALLLARERSAKPATVLAVTVVSMIAAVLGVIGIMKIQSIGNQLGGLVGPGVGLYLTVLGFVCAAVGGVITLRNRHA